MKAETSTPKPYYQCSITSMDDSEQHTIIVSQLGGEWFLADCSSGETLPLSRSADPHMILQSSPTSRLEAARDQLLRSIGPRGLTRFSQLPQIESVKTLAESKMPARKWFWQDRITVGLTILAARKRAGKTQLAFELAGQIAKGGEYLGAATKQSRVLYLQLELDRTTTWDRAQFVPLECRNFSIAHDWRRGDEGIEDLRIVMKAGLFEVVIIDMIGEVVPPGHVFESYSDANFWWRLRRTAQETSGAVVGLWHTGKGRHADYVDNLIGSTGLAGQSDTVLELERDTKNNLGRLSIAGNHVIDQTVNVRWDDHHWVISEVPMPKRVVRSAKAWEPTPFQSEVFELVGKKDGPVSPRQLVPLLAGEASVEKVRGALRSLEGNRLIHKVEGGWRKSLS
jgi:hypothetical protein